MSSIGLWRAYRKMEIYVDIRRMSIEFMEITDRWSWDEISFIIFWSEKCVRGIRFRLESIVGLGCRVNEWSKIEEFVHA